MNRIEVIQKIIDRTGAQNYLEIGSAGGEGFLAIRAKRKVAVDRNLKVPLNRRLETIGRNWRSKYYELSSEEFFAKVKLSHGFDVVFIDGGRTFQQSLREVENALSVLGSNGVIVMHDCNPTDPALAEVPGPNGPGLGEAWKTICHLRSQRPDLNVFVLDCDSGLGIITRRRTEDFLELDGGTLQKMDYAALAGNRDRLLNLKSENYLPEFLVKL